MTAPAIEAEGYVNKTGGESMPQAEHDAYLRMATDALSTPEYARQSDALKSQLRARQNAASLTVVGGIVGPVGLGTALAFAVAAPFIALALLAIPLVLLGVKMSTKAKHTYETDSEALRRHTIEAAQKAAEKRQRQATTREPAAHSDARDTLRPTGPSGVTT